MREGFKAVTPGEVGGEGEGEGGVQTQHEETFLCQECGQNLE